MKLFKVILECFGEEYSREETVQAETTVEVYGMDFDGWQVVDVQECGIDAYAAERSAHDEFMYGGYAMKIGKETGSLINWLYSSMSGKLPEVGEAATLLYWTDRNAATVTNVFTVGKSLFATVQTDHAKVVDGSGQEGSAKYEYSANPNGITYTFRFNGKWENVRLNSSTGRYIKTGGAGLLVGKRDHYYDPHF